MKKELNETIGDNDSLQAYKKRIYQLEELLKIKAKQLDELTRELDDISFSISHDLKAPLRAVTGFSAILLEEQLKNLDDEGKRLLHVIDSNAKKMTGMITNIVEHSSITKKSIVYSDINMKQAAEQNLANLLTTEERKHMTVIVGDLPACRADAKMINQLWLNLLNIALLHSYKNQLFTIILGWEDDQAMTTYFIKVTKESTGNIKNKLTASPGQPVIHEYLEGTGNGSAFVKRILFKHAGNFWIQSSPDKGSVFYFSLPKAG